MSSDGLCIETPGCGQIGSLCPWCRRSVCHDHIKAHSCSCAEFPRRAVTSIHAGFRELAQELRELADMVERGEVTHAAWVSYKEDGPLYGGNWIAQDSNLIVLGLFEWAKARILRFIDTGKV